MFENVSAKQAQTIMEDSSVVVLDVRTANEYNDGHIKDALNIDIKSENFMDEMQKLDKDTTYVMHCRSGGRSAMALEKVKDFGFKKIYHMDGGMLEWAENNLPIEK
ncbi:rhodanese-like domain-containing protein [Candidatus Uabimicrobium amorphum]|uniref:rhodanese-like domain-containing protein n=1 Tax=Uabimicrobium amorphum TaxID=2596890 RepID=UPI00156456B0|nr:rhodanese-like domain-containing protein [Candidatus Uabimicrobium amorphum]